MLFHQFIGKLTWSF